MAVDTPNAEYNDGLEDRDLVAALNAGTPGMRARAGEYLPREPKESAASYANRAKRTYLVNFYTKTKEKFLGKLIHKDPVIIEETPDEIGDLWDNIDNNGNDVPTINRKLADCAIDDGIVFGFVDAPPDPNGGQEEMLDENGEPRKQQPRTKATDMRLGLRPYMRVIKAKNLIAWDYDIEGGKFTLTQIRIAETARKPDPDDPEWSQITVKRIRVVEPFLQTLYEFQETTDGEKWVIVDEIVTEFEEIPLIPLYAKETGFLTGEPLFKDLAYLNLHHYQAYSDYSHISHVIQIPLLAMEGGAEFGEEVEIEIGANSVIHTPAGAELKYVEHTGKAAEVGKSFLESIEDSVVRMGADIVLNKRTGANATATGRAIDKAESDSEMMTLANALENFWQEAFTLMAQAFGLADTRDDEDFGGINMNKDYKISMSDRQSLTELISLRTTGDLSREALWDELLRRGELSEDFDKDAEQIRLEGEEEDAMQKQADSIRLMEEASLSADDNEEMSDEEDDG